MSRTSLRATVAAGIVAVALPVTAAPATPALAARQSRSCPGAEPLVPGITFHHHRLARGVTLAEGHGRDPRGTVDIHVLRIRTADRGLSFTPLRRSLARLTPLTRLAARHRHLVAAVNTGFYDMYGTGAPYGPLVVGGRPVVLSATPQPVVGITRNRRVSDGTVWLRGRLRTDGRGHRVTAVNEAAPTAGLSVYTPAWGRQLVALPRHAITRVVQHGRLRATHGRPASVPRHSTLLVASGPRAHRWLAGVPLGSASTVTTRVAATHHAAFRQAYGVGSQWVARRGVKRAGFPCRAQPTSQPARTAIGYTDGGRQLVLVVVADHPGTSQHGLDADQMSGLLVQLGVSRGYAFDGSGSTELLARLPGHRGLSLRNYPADGRERPMPLGFGIEAT